MFTKLIARVSYFITILVLSAVIFLVYLSLSHVGTSGPVSFPKMLEGTANRPAVHRLLIPSLAKAGAGLVPDWLAQAFEKSPLSLGNAFHLFSNGQYPREASLALLLMFFSLVGFIFAEKALLKYLGYPENEQLILPAVIAILILPLTVHFGYVYDLPQMFLFTASLLALYLGRWRVYLPLFAVTTLNKETSFFLVIIFGLYFFRRLALRTYLFLLAAQTGIFLLIYGAIACIYRNNPGDSIFWTLQFHMNQYSEHPVTFVLTILLFSVIIFLGAKDWKNKPLFLRYSFATFFVTLFLFLTSGREMEFRVFLDTLPIFGILIFPHHQIQFPEAHPKT